MKFRLRSSSKERSPRRLRSVRIADRDGKFQIEGVGSWHSYWRDPYHLLLTIPWAGFVAIVSLAYVLINSIFALLYLAGGDCLEGARPGSFEDAFFFSVHTLASIGYGVIAPKTTYANTIVTLEAIVSLLTIAVVTGLAFARFAKPTARVVFSRFAVIAPHGGMPTLMLRMANERRNHILEAQLRVYLLRDEITSEGEYFYRIHELQLSRSRSPSLTLTWTAMHPIDETSPLYGVTPQSLAKTHAQIVVTFTGIDDTVSYTVNLRHVYSAKEILCNHRFMDIIFKSPDGDRYFDYTNFHKVVPIESAATAMEKTEEASEFHKGLGLG
jgi:inward rectifier potassium channel